MKNFFRFILNFLGLTNKKPTETEFVTKIIKGHYERIEDQEVSEIVKRFGSWIAQRDGLWEKMSPKSKVLRGWLIKKNMQNPFSTKWSDNPPKEGTVEIFIKDVFTVPFPSLSDMDDWAISTGVTDVLLLQNVQILSRGSQEFYIHKKNHWVNHEMCSGIIELDIYKII